MDELRKEFKELRACGEKIVTLADTLLKELCSEEEVITYTLEDVRKACTEKSRLGRTDSVKAVLLKHGAEKLSDIKPEDYPSLMRDVEAL